MDRSATPEAFLLNSSPLPHKRPNLRVVLGQINTTPGDFVGNVAKIQAGMDHHDKHHPVDVIVFPELCIPGYLSRDLMYIENYVDKNLEALHELAEYSKKDRHKGKHIIVGYIGRNLSGTGKPFTNMAAVICEGKIVATYQKQLLPFYDVFDEGRYFEPGTELTVLRINGEKIGLCICEDVWNDKGEDAYTYRNNPIDRYRQIGVNTIISINSSPFTQGKPAVREKMLRDSSEVGDGMTIIYVNQIGGQDELVFDGNSFVVHNGMVPIIRSPVMYRDTFKYVDLKRVDFHHDILDGKREPLDFYSDAAQVHEVLTIGLRDYVHKNGFTDVVVGSSGGIDSALVLALSTAALGGKHVHAIMMPSKYSSEHSLEDAQKLHENLGCNEYLVPIEHDKLLSHTNACIEESCGGDVPFPQGEKYAPVADENLQARLRDVVIMHLSNSRPGIMPLSTGNKSESAVGYYTLFDLNLGYAPIMDLYKKDPGNDLISIEGLARHINRNGEVIPNNIIEKPPSAELAPGQEDEASLLPYPILDKIIRECIEHYIENYQEFRRQHPELEEAEELTEDSYKRIIRLIHINEYKRRQSTLGIKISKVAFGTGRRYPVVKVMA